MNPHTFFVVAVLAAGGASACGSTNDSASPTLVFPSANASTFNITVTGSKMAPSDKLAAVKGQTITMTVACDKSEEIHLHGFDRKFACKPGAPVTQTFPADRTGSFEIEIEDSSTHLGELDINPS